MTWEMWVGIATVATALLGVLAAVLASSHRLGERITEVRTELKEPISEVKADLTGQIAEVKADLTGQIAEVKADLTGQIIGLDAKIDSVKAELTGQIAEVKADLTGQIAEVRRSVQVVDDRVFVAMSGAVLTPRPADDQTDQQSTSKRLGA